MRITAGGIPCFLPGFAAIVNDLVSGGVRDSDFGIRISVFRFRGVVFLVSSLGFRVSGLEFRVSGSGLAVYPTLV